MDEWTRREFLVWVAAGTCAAAWWPGALRAGPPPQAARPNIVLLVADDLGFGQLGYEGNRAAKTPRLDALAAGNVRLTRCYAAHSLCAPSRMAVMTGRNAFRVGCTGGLSGNLSPQETILTRVLRDRGYRTGHFGKWHMWARPSDPQFGMDEYLFTQNNSAHVNPTYAEDCDGKGRRKAGRIEGDDSEIIVRRCLEFVDRALAERKPFYANLWFHTVHSPNGSAQRFRDLYPGVKDSDYLSDLSAMDWAVGLLHDELKRRGLDENTLLVFAGDNGMGRAADETVRIRAKDGVTDAVSNKGGMGENAVRVPGIVRWPARLPKAGAVAIPVAGCDWMPTFLAAAGAGAAGCRPFDGVDVLPLLTGPAAQRPDIGFRDQSSHTGPGRWYLIRGDCRLLREADGSHSLWRLGADNAMSPVEDAALKGQLVEGLAAWRDSVIADGTRAQAEAAAAGRVRR